jgi:hypothetical protein
MSENNENKRPVRKLTVKNFSVIKEAELEFGKITVLIGPQASGKSLLCKLAFFFSQFVPEFGNTIAIRLQPYAEIRRAIQQRFADWFPSTGYSDHESAIAYDSGIFSVAASIQPLRREPILEFSKSFEDEYERWKTSPRNAEEPNRNLDLLAGPFRPSGAVYVPSGRAFFSTPNKSVVAVSQKNLDWITQRFSTEIDLDYRAMIASAQGKSKPLSEFGNQAERILRGRIVHFEGVPKFQPSAESLIVPFELLSSGTLELLPLLNPISKLVSGAKYPKYFEDPKTQLGPMFIEEPESGVFPETQNKLVRLFAWLSREDTINLPTAITTHSPYILSAFNNLIEAGQAVRNNPQLRDEVAKIIPERYWIEDGEFKAYAIEDGNLRSILNDSGFVEGNYLDQVSETISDEFDRLIKLEYDHAKAS